MAQMWPLMVMKARSQWRSCSIKQNNKAITALIGIDLGAAGTSEIETDQLDPDLFESEKVVKQRAKWCHGSGRTQASFNGFRTAHYSLLRGNVNHCQAVSLWGENRFIILPFVLFSSSSLLYVHSVTIVLMMRIMITQSSCQNALYECD